MVSPHRRDACATNLVPKLSWELEGILMIMVICYRKPKTENRKLYL